MKYTRVSFNESFQEWAKANGVDCSCGVLSPKSHEGHKDECPMAKASAHWKAESNKLYVALKLANPVTAISTNGEVTSVSSY